MTGADCPRADATCASALSGLLGSLLPFGKQISFIISKKPIGDCGFRSLAGRACFSIFTPMLQQSKPGDTSLKKKA